MSQAPHPNPLPNPHPDDYLVYKFVVIRVRMAKIGGPAQSVHIEPAIMQFVQEFEAAYPHLAEEYTHDSELDWDQDWIRGDHG